MIAIVAFMAPTAAEVAQHVQDHYAKVTQLQVEFDQKVTSATFGRTTASHGVLFLKKPDLFRVNYAKVVGGKPKQDKDFIYDGKTLTVIDYPNLTITTTAANTLAIPAIATFLTNGDLAATYNLALSGDKLVLTPKKPDASVKKLDLVVDLKTWDVNESSVTSPSGDTSDFVLHARSTGLIPPDMFVVNPKSFPTYKIVTASAAPAPTPAPTKAAKAPTPAATPTPPHR